MEDIRAGRKEEVPTKPSENLEEIYKNNLENIEQVPVKEEKQIEPDFVIGKKMQPTYEEKSGANFDEIAASKHVERQVVMWEEAEEAIREETWEEFEEETRGAVQEETREEVEEETQEAVQEETREEVEEKTQEAVQEETWEEFEEEAEEAIQEETWEEFEEEAEEAIQEETWEEVEEEIEVAIQEEWEAVQEQSQEATHLKTRKESQEFIQNKPQVAEARPVSTEPKGEQPPVPFNVIMLPQDRSKKAEQRKSFLPKKEERSSYMYPSIQLLNFPQVKSEDDSGWLDEQATLLEETLQSFNVDAKVVLVTKGPSVTRFEIQPARGVKVNKVTNLTDDIKLSLAAKDIRIEAPIPGKNTIGIEVPNRASVPVFLREILRRDVFIQPDSPLTVALGLDISGQPIVTDLKKMPHGLVAGATGSGKSVCINSILISLLFKANPDEVKLLLIDPKMVELAPYNELPHLITPVITDAKQATAALKWVVAEMERRYELFSQQGVRDVGRYNQLYSDSPDKPALPYILVVIDELADLMMVSPQDVEDAICRIAQKARACGIHLLLATQRPSVDVITGLIKANIPTRVAFSVSSTTDSRTILDMSGAERLLGKGDMLFHENGSPKPIRVQGTFVSDEEIEYVIAHVKKQRAPNYLLETDQLQKVQEFNEQEDELFEEACHFVIEQGSASASSLQRRFRVGYNRAARLIDMMEARGVVSEAMGSKPRHVLMDELELEEALYSSE